VADHFRKFLPTVKSFLPHHTIDALFHHGMKISPKRCQVNGLCPWKAFSMVEMLAVMAVISTLSVIIVPAFRETLDRISLTGAAALVDAEISLARQAAMSRGIPVEFRIYQDEVSGDGQWRQFAVVITSGDDGSGQVEWVTRGSFLPGNILFDDDEQFSTVLSYADPLTSNPTAPWSGRESHNAPSGLRNKPFVGFSFNADGSTNLPPNGSWCLTLRVPNTPRVANQPAANFVSIVLDPLTGRSMLLQP